MAFGRRSRPLRQEFSSMQYNNNNCDRMRAAESVRVSSVEPPKIARAFALKRMRNAITVKLKLHDSCPKPLHPLGPRSR